MTRVHNAILATRINKLQLQATTGNNLMRMMFNKRNQMSGILITILQLPFYSSKADNQFMVMKARSVVNHWGKGDMQAPWNVRQVLFLDLNDRYTL